MSSHASASDLPYSGLKPLGGETFVGSEGAVEQKQKRNAVFTSRLAVKFVPGFWFKDVDMGARRTNKLEQGEYSCAAPRHGLVPVDQLCSWQDQLYDLEFSSQSLFHV